MTDNFFCPYEMVGGQMQGLKELEKENNKNCKEELKIINLKMQYFDRDPSKFESDFYNISIYLQNPHFVMITF